MWIRTQDDELVDITGGTIFKDCDEDYFICFTRTSQYDTYEELGAYVNEVDRDLVFKLIAGAIESNAPYFDMRNDRLYEFINSIKEEFKL